MQARIKEAKTAANTRRNAHAQNTDKPANSDKNALLSSVGNSVGNTVGRFSNTFTANLSALLKKGANTNVNANGTPINPMGVSRGLTYLLMLACAVSATYWLMRVAQVPSAPGQAASGINKGMTLYSNQDASAAYALFGNKPLVTDNIYLRGVVITSRNKDGFAIFEIDGKPTNAISVGEGLGKGLTLQSIVDETATLLYQGQKLDFKLSKAGSDKNDKSAKATSKK